LFVIPCGKLELSVSRFLVNQNSLLPFAGLLICAMNTASPAAWALLTFEKFLNSSPDSPCPCLVLFCVFNPTYEFVAPDRRQPFPETHGLVRLDERIEQVIGHVMYKPAGKFLRHKLGPNRAAAKGQ
jgi:hypothetical protein